MRPRILHLPPRVDARQREVLPRGHQEQAPGRGDERLDLLAVARIVEQQEHAPLGQDRAVLPRELSLALGQLRLRLDRADDVRHHLRRRERLRTRALQIDIDLPVGVVAGELLRQLEGELGLPDAALPREPGDDDTGA